MPTDAHYDEKNNKFAARRLNTRTMRLELKQVQKDFIEWLILPEKPEGLPTQRAFAAAHDVSENTLAEWKRDRDFVAEWEDRMRETHATPERQSTLMDVLFEQATQGSGVGRVKAIELYYKLIDRMSPQKLEVTSKASRLEEMSDEELAELTDNISFLNDKTG